LRDRFIDLAFAMPHLLREIVVVFFVQLANNSPPDEIHGRRGHAGLDTMAAKYPVIGDVRGRGLMQAVELVSDREAKTPDAATTAALNAACHRAGLLTLTCGSFGNVMRFLPPLIISEELLDEGLTIFESALAEVAA